MYDVQSKKTFENAKHLWLRELRDSADEDSGLLSCVMLVGNKIDLEKTADNIETFVGEKEHVAACKELDLQSSRTSAKTGQGVEKAFKDLIISECSCRPNQPWWMPCDQPCSSCRNIRFGQGKGKGCVPVWWHDCHRHEREAGQIRVLLRRTSVAAAANPCHSGAIGSDSGAWI